MSTLEEYFCRQLNSILRAPVGVMRHPFLVPGGLYQDELWDWDSFWVAKGFFAGRELLGPALNAELLDHAIGSWKNFFEQQVQNGTVPIMIKSDCPDFFGCTSERGMETNQAKPIFGQFALDVSLAAESYDWIEPHFDALLRFHARWTSRYQSPCGLLTWGSDVAIGVDCDPTTYGRPPFSSANLLLNCLFHRDLTATAEIAQALGRADDVARLRSQAAELGAAVQRECWDEVDAFFYSVDTQCQDHRDKFLPGLKKGMPMTWSTLPTKIKMFTGFLPLWCGIASDTQARLLVEQHLRSEAEFSASWGVRSLAKNEKMYQPEVDSVNPSNWLGPIWTVVNYMVHQGLKNYGYHEDARQLAEKTVSLLAADLRQSGTLHECYHPDTGAPNFNHHFLSWNSLALAMIG